MIPQVTSGEHEVLGGEGSGLLSDGVGMEAPFMSLQLPRGLWACALRKDERLTLVEFCLRLACYRLKPLEAHQLIPHCAAGHVLRMIALGHKPAKQFPCSVPSQG